MTIKIAICVLVFCLVLPGCVSLETRKTKILKLEYNDSISDVIEKIGKPSEQVEISSDITRLTYRSSDMVMTQYASSKNLYWLYFRNDKLVKKSTNDNFYQDIEDYYSLGLISKEDYQRESDNRREDMRTILPAAIAMQSQMSNMRYQRQSLNNQRVILQNQQKILSKQQNSSNNQNFQVQNVPQVIYNKDNFVSCDPIYKDIERTTSNAGKVPSQFEKNDSKTVYMQDSGPSSVSIMDSGSGKEIYRFQDVGQCQSRIKE